jgi:hypothetical protein
METLHLKKTNMASISGHFENILFELGAVDYSRIPIFVLIRFLEIRKILTNGLRESPCIFLLYILYLQ